MIHGRTAATGPGRQREQRPGLQVRRSTRVRLASAALMLTAAVGATRADNVVGAWDSPVANNWPLISVHAALTPDGRVLTYGTWSVINGNNNPAQQTGFFKYDIWNPAAGLSGGHLTLDSARESDIFCSSQVDPAGQRQCLHRRRRQLDGNRHHQHGQQQQQHLPPVRQHTVSGGHHQRTAARIQEHEPGAVVLVLHCAREWRDLHPGRQRRWRPARSPRQQRQFPPAEQRQYVLARRRPFRETFSPPTAGYSATTPTGTCTT